VTIEVEVALELDQRARERQALHAAALHDHRARIRSRHDLAHLGERLALVVAQRARGGGPPVALSSLSWHSSQTSPESIDSLIFGL
jgi:hypothetical protein